MEGNLTLVEEKLWLITKTTGFGQYDFSFENLFHCSHPYQINEEVTAVSRMGATEDYKNRFEQLLLNGVRLIHSPDEYARTSLLPEWYPLIHNHTPKSLWFDTPPDVEDIECQFSWPVFVKGERQTHKHNGSLAIIRDSEHYHRIKKIWKEDPILWWQKIVIREFLDLKPAAANAPPSSMQKSYEFRTFWWKGNCVGMGRYWIAVDYNYTAEDEYIMIRIGKEVSSKIDVVFLVIDFAKTKAGDWIVIECNDGQDSGYAGVKPFQMWSRILDLEN